MADPNSPPAAFWETDEAVARFAARDPDDRLVRMVEEYTDPARIRVLDLGCAAGRNTVVLAREGFDFYALDSSAAMVERTRARVAEIVGEAEAGRRIFQGCMEDLSTFSEARFDLVVALGVLHQAGTGAVWHGALHEVSRVLAIGGLLLFAGWSPRTRPNGIPLQKVPGEEHVFLGFHSGRHFLLDPASMDHLLTPYGLIPAEPTEEVRVETEKGERFTVNGLYRRLSE